MTRTNIEIDDDLIARVMARYEAAAAIYRACRRAGYVVATQLDCVIAAVAMRTELPLLHADSDFDAIARHTSLEVA